MGSEMSNFKGLCCATVLGTGYSVEIALSPSVTSAVQQRVECQLRALESGLILSAEPANRLDLFGDLPHCASSQCSGAFDEPT